MADLEVQTFVDDFMAAANEAAACVVIGAAQLGAANIFSVNGAASTPAAKLTGSWFTGGSATTTKPQLLVEPSGATSTAWSTSGTGLGVNGASGFGGNLIDAQLNGAARFYVAAGGTGYISGNWNVGGLLICTSSLALPNNASGVIYNNGNYAAFTNAPSVLGDYTAAILNSTNACKFHVFRTRTDASNYERLALQSGSGYFELAAETAGTGTDNIGLRLTPAGTGAVQVTAGLLQLHGDTSSYPALKRSSTTIQARLADDSGYADVDAGAYSVGGVAGVNGGPFATISSITVVNGIVTAISGAP